MNKTQITLGFITILLIALSLPFSGTYSSNNFVVTEKSRVEWSQVWESVVSAEENPELVFQGKEGSLDLHLDTHDKLLLQIIELYDTGEFTAYLGVEGENPSGKLSNPRFIFEDVQIPLLFPLETNLTHEVELLGIDFLSSNSSGIFFYTEKDINATHAFKLSIGYLHDDHLLNSLNAAWHEKNAAEVPVLEFSLFDPRIKERFSEVSEPIEWIASAFLLILGLGIILVTKIRD